MSALTFPPAPARLSTMTVCPSASPSFAPTTRAIVSLGPPGRKPTTKRIGRPGYFASAAAAGVDISEATTAAAAWKGFIFTSIVHSALFWQFQPKEEGIGGNL